MKESGERVELRDRTKRLALRIIRMYSALPQGEVPRVLGRQVLRSGTSVGANYREASRARSTAEFVAKLGDSLKELEETAYWLELLVESDCVTAHQMSELLRDCPETQRGSAARDFGGGQGGEAGASPRRSATAEPTQATGKRPAARRVFAETARSLRCSSVADPCGYAPSSRLHPAEAAMRRRIAIGPFPRKQDPSEFSDNLFKKRTN